MEPASAGFFVSACGWDRMRREKGQGRVKTKKPAKAGFHDAAETGSSPP
jgi:hypothetical protein